MRALEWLFGPGGRERPGKLWPRWLFLRALGAVYFSAFFSLLLQARGLIGLQGILPAVDYLHAVARQLGATGYWYAPTVLWFSASDRMLAGLCWAGLAAAMLVIFNVWPRLSLAVCWVVFLSFVAGLQDFSSYQSDSMLLEAGFIAMFFAPPGMRPRLGAASPPSRASTFLLQWEWFRIYLESGIGKIASGDPTWRNLTAMDEYYQNGPLPTWLGWYAQHLPQGFHAFTAGATLALELVIVWMMFLPRRYRLLCFCVVTPFEIGIIFTANYCFLNYLVLWLGVLLLDDGIVSRLWPYARRRGIQEAVRMRAAERTGTASRETVQAQESPAWKRLLPLVPAAICLSLVFYAGTFWLLVPVARSLPLPYGPVRIIQPFQIANRYGLFARMTWARYEIEFQGSDDGLHWIPYPYRFKPQRLDQAPLVYAPFQPRFEWNLWFAMLGPLQDAPWVVNVEGRLLEGSPPVLALFAGNPFPEHPPKRVRAVIYGYWFTDLKTQRATGQWWRRKYLGRFAPTLALTPTGRFDLVEAPDEAPPPP